MRLRSAIVAAIAVGAVVAPTGPASAATAQCSIVAPTKIVIDREYRAVPLRLSSNCAAAGAVYAEWDFIHSTKGWQNFAVFDGTTTDTLDVYDWDTPVGTYTVRPWEAYTSDFTDLTQNTATTQVKLGSRLAVTATRSSTRLTINGAATVFSPTYSRWYQRANATVALMYLAPGSTTWTWVKNGTTSTTGKVTLTATRKAGQYRLIVKET